MNWTLLIAISVLGCDGVASSGAEVDANAEVGIIDASSPPDAGVRCRTYASAYTFASSLGANYSYSCTHGEPGGFERRCQQLGVSSVDTERWASRSDFVDEAAEVGIVKLLSRTRSSPASQTLFEYDAQKRLLRILQ